MQLKYVGLLTFLVFGMLSCTNRTKDAQLSTSPEYINHEVLMTRNPVTGNVEREKLWSYLLNQKTTMGRNQSLNKTVVYPQSWKPVDDFFASIAVQRLAYDPNNTMLMYFCTGEGWNNADAARGSGVWKSIDGGESWNNLGATLTDTFWYCHDLAVHPVTSDIYVATRGAGLMRSQDGGNTWNPVLNADLGSGSDQTTDIEITADNELVVSIGNFSTDGIYFSTTGNPGDWEKRMTGMSTDNRRIEIATAPSDANVMYAVPTSSIRLDSNRIHGVYRTSDKGLNWVLTSLPGGDRNLAKKQGWYDLSLKVSPTDANVVLVGGLNVFRTTDGGQDWAQMFEGDRRKKSSLQYVHVDQHEVTFKNSETVLLGNDGGIYRCDNILADTPFFYSINKNYNVTQFYACDIDESKASTFVIGGTQDNGSLGSESDGVAEFRQLSWADGSYCNIDHQDGDIFYTTTQYRRLYRNNHGVIDTLTNDNIVNNNTLFINPIDMDPNDPEILYQLTNRGLWRLKKARTATGNDWEKACRTFGSFSAIGISKSAPNTVFLGRTTGGVIYRVDNANISPDNFLPVNCDPSGFLPDAYCRNVYVDPSDVNHLIVTYSNYGIESIWETKDAMSGNPTWTSQEGDLPDIPIRWAVLHPDDKGVCYLGTEAGVMMTLKLDGSNTPWTSINTGLANLKVNMLRIRSIDNTLVAATHGRGIYTGKINSDFTVEWEERGPRNVGGRTRTLVFDLNDPTGKKLWAGSVSGGLWVVENFDSVNTSVEVFDAPYSVKIGPNPVVGETVSVFITTDVQRTVDIEIFDLSGQKVASVQSTMAAGSHTVVMPTQGWFASSIYFIQVTSGEQKEVFKVVVF
ncbi:MAG: photosystem II stability/assembly factor-like uncharacterized protein [Bacteroidia bacterium]|jgi:photosystem II stability/assembly factor-like uncharacterized protein